MYLASNTFQGGDACEHSEKCNSCSVDGHWNPVAVGCTGPANLARQVAANGRRWWRTSAMSIHIVLPTQLFNGLGLPRLAE
jgi:hypothetical protein